jgi:hypothetical protein
MRPVLNSFGFVFTGACAILAVNHPRTTYEKNDLPAVIAHSVGRL